MLRYIANALNSGSFSIIDFFSYLLSTLAVIFITMPIHECAHGFVSTKLGDPTPKYQGRLTLNPMAHFDKRGALLLLLFNIGWAKPVQVNARYYKNPKWGMALVALAGPVANLVLSFVVVILLYLFEMFNFFGIDSIGAFLVNVAYISTYLAVFNLIPIPPFDGSRILFAILPQKYYFKIMRYENYIFMVLMVLFLLDSRIGIISGTIGTLAQLLLNLITSLALLIFKPFGV